MDETLVQKQNRFARAISYLIIWAQDQGYMVTWGWAWRPIEADEFYSRKGTGIKNSLHTLRLAADLNLYVEGIYQTNSDAYRPLGEKWKSYGNDYAWGGDFSKPDGNHFSIEHNGVK